ncbi:MAG TPA: Rne/Rng family ribonuclease [Propylenella sp.]|nr:Rne/Rng family ribonuclease [Propylenella sp.]
MSNKMLIDATHPEETRVVVLRGNRVEEFDFEAADRQQLRGNIYLAKVTRVEPSLQAAFVDYGGNRHGFLAFSEIHPDYYQIPYADRQALLQQQAEEDEEEAAEEEAADAAAAAQADAADEAARESVEAVAERRPHDSAEVSEPAASDAADQPLMVSDADFVVASGEGEALPAAGESPEEDAGASGREGTASREDSRRGDGNDDVRGDNGDAEHDDEHVESVGAEDALEEVPERRKPRPRQYKIQEVIKRRQVLLVQVVKEERGNKGAALTTYLSLAGRYSVLMPNTGRGGGISRKITNPADRKRLKSIASELDVPEGMGVILRTAGANRTKAEVKRDFEYLLRLWENVRELTLRSTAPKLVYEEGSLIKRSIRDLYSREIDQVVVAGENAYREAKDFMRMLMPSHARHVQLYKDETPIFARNGVEAQLDAMFSPQVTLRSGGYIVINQTEALVSIDVNSGRSTREHSIEDTALNTNLEAAEEIARQLRLRDLAGLIVIDFIDMEEKRNNRSVERKLKDCLRADRARIQVGRISHFGLLEMSRQRIRTGVLESSTVPCPHCRGTGQVRSISSLALQILRAMEDHLLRHSGHHLYVRTRPEAALYVLNQKRRHVAQLEERFGLTITISGEAPEHAAFVVERGAPVEDRPERAPPVAMEAPVYRDAAADFAEVDEEEERDEEPGEERAAESAEGGRDKRRRRRRRRGNGDDRHDQRARSEEPRFAEAGDVEEVEGEAEGDADEVEAHGRPRDEDSAAQDARRRRRGRRGGRRRGRGREDTDYVGGRPQREDFATDAAFAPADPSEAEALSGGGELPWAGHMPTISEAFEPDPAEFPLAVAAAEGRDEREPEHADADFQAPSSQETAEDARSPQSENEAPAEPAQDGAVHAPIHSEPLPAPSGADGDEAAPEPVPQPMTAPETVPEPVAAPRVLEDDRPKRSGWWNRKSFF